MTLDTPEQDGRVHRADVLARVDGERPALQLPEPLACSASAPGIASASAVAAGHGRQHAHRDSIAAIQH